MSELLLPAWLIGSSMFVPVRGEYVTVFTASTLQQPGPVSPWTRVVTVKNTNCVEIYMVVPTDEPFRFFMMR